MADGNIVSEIKLTYDKDFKTRAKRNANTVNTRKIAGNDGKTAELHPPYASDT